MRLSLTIAWPAWLGFNSLGVMIGRVFAGLWYFVIGDPEYSSRIRGGVNCFRLFVSDTEYFLSRECDILMPFDSTNAKAFSDTLSPSGCIIANAKIAEKISAISAPQYSIHHEEKFDNIYFFWVFGKLFLLEKELLLEEIETLFAHKPDVRDANRSILEKAYEEDIPESIRGLFAKTRIMRVGKPKQFTYGNALIAEGAVKAGLNYYAGYPMTPASSLLVECAKHPGVTVLQPEDEIAVANSVLWAHFAGARAMCGTSGGGFALMSEALSFADQAEIWGVFILSSRAGPSTGTPTFTECADIDFALTPTFGGIRHIVMAPSDGHDAYTLIQHALNHADQFQIPVIFLIDKQLSESYISYDDDFPPVPIDRGKLILDDIPEDSFARYALTSDSLSPRTVPWVKNGDFIATSYEHDTYGATSEDRAMKIRMTEKRFHKTDSLFSESIHGYEIVHPRAKKMFVVAGMTSMVARSFVQQHPEYGLIIIRYLKPFDLRIREEISEVEEFIFLEMNYSGQLKMLFQNEVGYEVLVGKKLNVYSKVDLLPFTLENLDTVKEVDTRDENTKLLISYFKTVRDIPYEISLSQSPENHSCSWKHVLLKQLFSQRWVRSRFRVCRFYWNSLPIPENILSLSHEDEGLHVYLEVYIDRVWRTVDATWDNGLQGVFPIQQWNGKEDTSIAVTPHAILSPEESETIMNPEKDQEVEKKNLAFYEAINRWLVAQRKIL